MVWSKAWTSSKKPRKQRAYVAMAPLHVKRASLGAHLSKELAKRYGRRTLELRKGDQVMVMRGEFKKKIGTVEWVNLKKPAVRISGLERIRKDGSKVGVLFHPSKLQIIQLELSDKRRAEKLKVMGSVKAS
ncbi:MAG: 50S ribosomal protein L24 [Candidatus Woesearchaeota archaeon]